MEGNKKTNINEYPGETEVEVGIGSRDRDRVEVGIGSRDRDRDSGDVKRYGVRGVPLTITPPPRKTSPRCFRGRSRRVEDQRNVCRVS